MKVSQLRGIINELSSGQPDISELDKALKRFDGMELSKFCDMVRGLKSPVDKAASKQHNARKNSSGHLEPSDVARRVIKLKNDPPAFETALKTLEKNRSFTKKDLQDLYAAVFSTKTKLSASLSKAEMVARFIRQRRRDANFASA